MFALQTANHQLLITNRRIYFASQSTLSRKPQTSCVALRSPEPVEGSERSESNGSTLKTQNYLACFPRRCYNKVMAYKFFNKRQLEFLQKGFGFTDRQMQIIELICRGTNNTGLSNILKITPQTAKTHVRNICRKTHSRGRSELILTLLHHSRHLRHFKD